jgi:hypothetical protein
VGDTDTDMSLQFVGTAELSRCKTLLDRDADETGLPMVACVLPMPFAFLWLCQRRQRTREAGAQQPGVLGIVHKALQDAWPRQVLLDLRCSHRCPSQGRRACQLHTIVLRLCQLCNTALCLCTLSASWVCILRKAHLDCSWIDPSS